jgi:hypothetical protein
MDRNTQNETRKKARPILMGVIIDASSSMSKNWNNKRGKKLPKIEVIRNTFNRHFNRIYQLTKSKNNNIPNINLFCLGIGFIVPQTFVAVRIEEGKEETINTDQQIIRSDIICDLIALSELVPSKSLIEQVRESLNKRWNQYSSSIINQTSFKQDVFTQLKSYIRDTLRSSATGNLSRNWRITLKSGVEKYQISDYEIGRKIVSNLDKYIHGWQEKIITKSDLEAERFFNNIIKESDNIFQSNQQEYTKFIYDTIVDFAKSECQKILNLLTLGYDHKSVINTFNEYKALNLAKTIYSKLDLDVRKSIAVAWNINKINLVLAEKELRGSLDHKQVQRITEQCIQKYGWSILKPFVEKMVTDIFIKTFEDEAKQMIPKWLTIASRREVIRPIKDITAILPETSEQNIYSKSFMFGTTPINEALERASHRFLEKSHKPKQKILLIVSDGEYQTSEAIYLTEQLKNIGVIVICCYISNRNIASKLMSTFSPRWPDGAKMMFQMASTSTDHPELIERLLQNGIEMPDNKKLFIQVNHSDILGDLMDALMLSEAHTSIL